MAAVRTPAPPVFRSANTLLVHLHVVPALHVTNSSAACLKANVNGAHVFHELDAPHHIEGSSEPPRPAGEIVLNDCLGREHRLGDRVV